MSDTGFNKAVKHLDIQPVSKQTGVKRDTIVKTRAIKKVPTQVDIEAHTFSLTIKQVTNNNAVNPTVVYRQWGEIHVNAGKSARLLNFNRLKNTQGLTLDVLDILFELNGTPLNTANDFAVRHIKDGQIERFRLGTVDQTRFANNFKAGVNAPFYNGEKLNAPFIIEVYNYLSQYPESNDGTWRTDIMPIKYIKLVLSRLQNPTTIDETVIYLPYTIYDRSDIDVDFVAGSLTFPITFPER